MYICAEAARLGGSYFDSVLAVLLYTDIQSNLTLLINKLANIEKMLAILSPSLSPKSALSVLSPLAVSHIDLFTRLLVPTASTVTPQMPIQFSQTSNT